MSENNGNGRRQEYEQATKDLRFTKDFNESIEAVMRDELEPASVRVLAWLKRRAWGNYSLYCVGDDGESLFQCDCSAELNIDKRRVSKTMQYLERRGYLGRHGNAKLLYPILSPVLGGPDSSIVKKSPAWATFLDEWKVAHVEDFSEYEVAYATYERIKKVLLADYKRWKNGATNGGASINESTEREIERESKQASISVEDPPEELACLPALAPIRKIFPQEQISDQTLVELDTKLSTEHGELYNPIHFVLAVDHRQRTGPPVRFGLLMKNGPGSWIADYFEQERRLAAERATVAERAEREREEAAVELAKLQQMEEDPVVERTQCLKCGGIIERYESGFVSYCACALRGKYVGST